MLQKELQELLNALKIDEYCTALQLSKVLDVSEKTVRLRIKELNRELDLYGARIISKARFGYQLIIEDEKQFSLMPKQENADQIPGTNQERNEYLLDYFIWTREYVKLDDLSDELYISKTTLAKSVKSVETILKRYALLLDRKPNYGVLLVGKESDIRRLICDYFITKNCSGVLNFVEKEGEFIELALHSKTLLLKYNIRLAETSFVNFINYVYVAWKRMQHGFYMNMNEENLPKLSLDEYAFAADLVGYLEEKGGVVYTKDEKQYLLLYLAGKRMIGNVVENESNFIIHENTDRLALAMLDFVYRTYNMNFYNNFDVRMTLNQHLVPFDIRMRFDIPLHNPLLEEIKEQYCLAYQISCEAVQVLRDHYQKDISEDEIGYFALIFELAMEREQKEEQSDILVVCSTGKGSSRLLKYKYEQEFAGYLRQIYVCDLMELDTFDFSKVQYVFTTVPITKEIPVPIVEVGVFLGTEDIQKVTDVLRRGTGDYLYDYFRPERFLSHVKLHAKDEVLEFICQIIYEQEDVDDNFYDLVLERESYIQMDYGCNIAIPHPNQIASEETFAYVVVLEEPIIWNQNPVQVILLSSVGRKEDANRQKFYEATARFALSGSAIECLIANPEFETLIDLLKE